MKRRVFDLHCDTAFKLYTKNQTLEKNRLEIDLARMEEYDTYIQVFAAFVDKTEIYTSPMKHCINLLHKIREEIGRHSDRITLITNAREMEKTLSEGKCGAILAIEGGEALEGNLSAIWMYYQLGVRLITLTWNWANELADGIWEPRGGGLTSFGKEAVRMMENMGIIVDVSHLSEQGFWDVAEMTSRPFVASHSCVKAICSHPRNLTDEQISCLIQRRGGMGINFFPEFLSDTGRCGIEEMIRHIEYVLALGGEDIVGLGSDFDGMKFLPDGMHGVEDVHWLISCMEKQNWSQTVINKVLYDNFRRIFLEIMEKGC